jgi:transposase
LGKNRDLSAIDLALELKGSKNVDVSVWTVRRTLWDMGLKYGKPRTVPLLTNDHKCKRLLWCRKFKRRHLAGMFFSDETYIEVGGGNGGVWHKLGNRPDRQKSKFPAKLMFWAAISNTAKSPLFPFRGTMDSRGYIDLIKAKFLLWLTENGHDLRRFQQDNAPCHVSKLSRDFLESQNITLINWPPNSPDLSPIENLWSVLKSKVGKRCPKNLQELEQFAIDKWAKLPQNLVKRTILSVPFHCKQVLERAGGKCDY